MQTLTAPSQIELREEGGTARLHGHAAVFYDETRSDETTYQMGDVEERILPGAFDSSLASNVDIVALVNHQTDQVLARRSAGNLTLSSDPRGLAFELQLNDSPRAQQLAADVRSGNIAGASFGFSVREGGAAWDKNVRNLTDVDLREISMVTFPAYQGTTVGLRCEISEDGVEALKLEKERHRRRRALELDEARYFVS